MTKRRLENIVPPVLMKTLRSLYSARRQDVVRFTGDFSSWEDAKRISTGYADPAILEKTRAAVRQVRDRQVAYERDSVVFEEIEHPFALLAGLLRAALNNNGRLSVLDFGGSLGSTYFQCRDFISTVDETHWNIVEQPAHVACGKSEFATDELRFYESPEECLLHETPNVLLLSGVVQYLPDPYEFLADMVRRRFNHIIVDRTAFLCSGRDRLTIEHVPDWIYPAAYPAWFLSEHRFLEQFNGHYDCIASFDALDTTQPEGDDKADYKGFIFDLRET